MRRPSSVAAMLALSLTACATIGGGGSDGPRRDPNLITSEELQESDVQTLSALEAVQRLRPRWLNPRAAATPASGGNTLPMVMIDSARGDASMLRGLRVAEIERMRYINPRDATTLYGTGYVTGIIEVTTKR